MEGDIASAPDGQLGVFSISEDLAADVESADRSSDSSLPPLDEDFVAKVSNWVKDEQRALTLAYDIDTLRDLRLEVESHIQEIETVKRRDLMSQGDATEDSTGAANKASEPFDRDKIASESPPVDDGLATSAAPLQSEFTASSIRSALVALMRRLERFCEQSSEIVQLLSQSTTEQSDQDSDLESKELLHRACLLFQKLDSDRSEFDSSLDIIDNSTTRIEGRDAEIHTSLNSTMRSQSRSDEIYSESTAGSGTRGSGTRSNRSSNSIASSSFSTESEHFLHKVQRLRQSQILFERERRQRLRSMLAIALRKHINPLLGTFGWPNAYEDIKLHSPAFSQFCDELRFALALGRSESTNQSRDNSNGVRGTSQDESMISVDSANEHKSVSSQSASSRGRRSATGASATTESSKNPTGVDHHGGSIEMMPAALYVAEPLLLMFRFHFFASKPTNDIHHPEWPAKWISNEIDKHTRFINTHIQPLVNSFLAESGTAADEAGSKDLNPRGAANVQKIDFLLEFALPLYAILQEKYRSWADEALSLEGHVFENILRQCSSFENELALRFNNQRIDSQMKPWPRMMSDAILSFDRTFEKWLSSHESSAIENLTELMETKDSFKPILENFEDGTLKPSKSSLKLIEFLRNANSLLDFAQSTERKLAILDRIHANVLNIYFSRLSESADAFLAIQDSSKFRAVPGAMYGDDSADISGVNGIDRIARIINNSLVVKQAIVEISYNISYLQIWSDAKKLSSKDLRQYPNLFVAGIEDTLLGNAISELSYVKDRAIKLLLAHAEKELQEVFKPYARINSWAMSKDRQGHLATMSSVTAQLLPIINHLDAITTYARRTLMSAVYIKFVRFLARCTQRIIWDKVLMSHQFSPFGSRQFARDVKEITRHLLEASNQITGQRSRSGSRASRDSRPDQYNKQSSNRRFKDFCVGIEAQLEDIRDAATVMSVSATSSEPLEQGDEITLQKLKDALSRADLDGDDPIRKRIGVKLTLRQLQSVIERRTDYWH